ncbi:MAG: YqjD family protein [Candidatus Tectimicrobiota bacterium]
MAETQEERKTGRQDKNTRAEGSQDTEPGTASQAAGNAQAADEQVRNTAQQVGTQVRDSAQELGSQAQAMGAKAQETLSEQYEYGRESLQDLQQTVEARVRENPLQSVLVAGAVGMLLGLLWRRS